MCREKKIQRKLLSPVVPPLCQTPACCVSFSSSPDVGVGCQTRCEMIVPNFGHHQAKNMVARTFGDLSSSPAEKPHGVQGVLGTSVILPKNSSHKRSVSISFSLSFQPCHMKEHTRLIQDLWREACQLRVVGDGFLQFSTRFPPFRPPHQVRPIKDNC